MKGLRFSRRTGWVLLSVVLAAVVLFVVRSPERLPRVEMSDGSVLTVVKVKVGTNSVFPSERDWKRYVRPFCPDRWENALLGAAPMVSVMRTRQDSLLIWVKHQGVNGKPTVNRRDWERILLAEGPEDTAVPATFGTSPGAVCLEFRTYRRDAARLSLKVWNGTNDVRLEVPNPRPASPAPWQAGLIPQTNRFPGSDIILHPLGIYASYRPDRFHPRLTVKSRGGEPAGWMEWHITITDAWGNWAEGGWPLRTPRPDLKCSGLRGSVWRLRADGVEYLSAGFVPPLTNGATVVIPIGDRAREFGVRCLVAVGAGSYRVADGVATFLPEKSVETLATAQLSAKTSKPKGWQAALMAPYPGVLCVTEGGSHHQARVRVRPGKIEGQKIWTSAVLEEEGKRLQFHFFSRHLPAVAGEKLEVEVFGPLPYLEYFIPSPLAIDTNSAPSGR